MEFTELPEDILDTIISKVEGSPEKIRTIAAVSKQLRDLPGTRATFLKRYGKNLRRAITEKNYPAVKYIVETYYKNNIPRNSLTQILSMIENDEYDINLYRIAQLLIDNNSNIDEIRTYLGKIREYENVNYIYKIIKYAQTVGKSPRFQLKDVIIENINVMFPEFYKKVFQDVLNQLKAGLFELNINTINIYRQSLEKLLPEVRKDKTLYSLVNQIFEVLNIIENNI